MPDCWLCEKHIKYKCDLRLVRLKAKRRVHNWGVKSSEGVIGAERDGDEY